MKNNLPVYIWTSNRQMCCLPAWCYLFNKHWPCKTTVKILGYDIPDFKLPDNFEYISLGKQRGPQYWSDDMIDYFSKCTDEYFFLTSEDGFIIEVNERILNYLTEVMIKNLDTNLLRIGLTKDVSKRPHNIITNYNDFQLISALPDTEYRNSLQHSIWNRKNFLKELPIGYSPWDFELKTGRYNSMNVLATKPSYSLRVGHGYKKGRKVKEWYLDQHEPQYGLLPEEIQKIENNNWLPEL